MYCLNCIRRDRNTTYETGLNYNDRLTSIEPTSLAQLFTNKMQLDIDIFITIYLSYYAI